MDDKKCWIAQDTEMLRDKKTPYCTTRGFAPLDTTVTDVAHALQRSTDKIWLREMANIPHGETKPVRMAQLDLSREYSRPKASLNKNLRGFSV